ncbi:Cationic amino acid transporter 8, vacuolar [Vitis vinifera]|uniref:Cationic amino acid transporter 8, vacuolar n=1 Tax=Vitis vinifera TaxID=29760 RepID=A0A438GMR0_VITVI|nr:Cationic amino acid transporter 8, vacuolar [Vitis vinifera]
MKRTSKISSSSKVDSKNQANKYIQNYPKGEDPNPLNGCLFLSYIHPKFLHVRASPLHMKKAHGLELDIQLRLHLGFGCHHIIHPQVNWRTTPTSFVSSSYILPLNADTHSYLSSLLFSTTLAEQIQNHKQPIRSYWRWSRQDFFPEESFQNLASYRTALLQTCFRLKDRLLSRSSVAKRVVGSGIFVITGQETRDRMGPAIVLSYAASGLSALLSVLCYTEFAVEIPVAGGSFSYLRVEIRRLRCISRGREHSLGGHCWCCWSGSVLVLLLCQYDQYKCRFFANSGESFSKWFQSVGPNSSRCFVNCRRFIRGKTSNLVPFFPYGARGVFRAAAVVYWSYTGFDMVATMAEETKNPTRDIPLGSVGSMTMITVVYCLMALVLSMMEKNNELDVNAAYAVVFERLGMKRAKYLVSICALKGMTTSLLIGGLGQARYMTQIARAHMIPPWRYYVKDTTVKRDLVKFLACLFVIIGSSIGIAVLWNPNKTGWIGYAVAAFIWFLRTLGMALLPKQRVANVWGVPLVPGCHLCQLR